jgi:membrane associated rhomboid family serine protease
MATVGMRGMKRWNRAGRKRGGVREFPAIIPLAMGGGLAFLLGNREPSESETAAITTTPTFPDLHPLGRFPTEAAAHEHALVALALGESCWVMGPEEDGAFQLLAEPEPAPRIAAELDAYIAEQPVQVPLQPVPEPEVFPLHPLWCVVWVASLVAVFRWQMMDPGVADRGVSSSVDLLMRHEWWRPFTALFMHADPIHLLGNVVTGSVFGLLVSRTVGALRGWMLILAAGALGNLATSLVAWPEEFRSLGASTAVFGALGILSGHGLGWALRFRHRLPMSRVIAPLAAGVILLGFLGGGGGSTQTDVLGHCNGFAAGVVLGAMTAWRDQRRA